MINGPLKWPNYRRQMKEGVTMLQSRILKISTSDRTDARERAREEHSRREQHEEQPASDIGSSVTRPSRRRGEGEARGRQSGSRSLTRPSPPSKVGCSRRSSSSTCNSILLPRTLGAQGVRFPFSPHPDSYRRNIPPIVIRAGFKSPSALPAAQDVSAPVVQYMMTRFPAATAALSSGVSCSMHFGCR